MRKQLTCATLSAIAICASAGAMAASDEWRFGIGTGLSSFSLDGDLGFATPVGGFVADIDLDNSDTSDLVDSALGVQGYASNGTWTILASYGTVALKDKSSDISAEWDRTMGELSAIYNFARTGSSVWGILAGVRYVDHEWEIRSRDGSFSDVEPDENWTDFIVGLSHVMQFNPCLSWRTRIDAGFGDSEEAYYALTGLFYQPGDHWQFNANAKYYSVEYGDKGDINKSDFYYYNVDEPAFGVGLMYTW